MAKAAKTELILQMNGRETDITDLATAAKRRIRKDLGIKIDTCKLYLKANEGMVYYVVNDSEFGGYQLSELL